MSPFTEKNWIDGTTHEIQGPSTTRISAVAIEDIETRVTDYTDQKTIVSVKEPPYSATGDGATDDTAAINSALAAIATGDGICYFPPGTYMIASRIDVPAGVDLRGAGMQTSGVGATTIKASAAGAGIRWGNPNVTIAYHGLNGGFTFDGNLLSTVGLQTSTVLASFKQITVRKCATGGGFLVAGQNNVFEKVIVEHCAANHWMLDYGAGGNEFLSCAANYTDGYQVEFLATATVAVNGYAAGPSYNRFSNCIFEQPGSTEFGGSPSGLMHYKAGVENYFENCNFTLSSSSVNFAGTAILIEPNDTAATGIVTNRLFLRDCRISGESGVGGVGVACDNVVAGTATTMDGEVVVLEGETLLSHFDNAFEWGTTSGCFNHGNLYLNTIGTLFNPEGANASPSLWARGIAAWGGPYGQYSLNNADKTATTAGTITAKIQAFDRDGSSLGWIPIYNAIS